MRVGGGRKGREGKEKRKGGVSYEREGGERETNE